MNELPVHNDFIFDMLYGAVTVSAIIACCYLLFRRGNAIAPDFQIYAILRDIIKSYGKWQCKCKKSVEKQQNIL